MRKIGLRLAGVALAAMLTMGAAPVSVNRALVAAPQAGDWPAAGRSYAEQRNSPLSSINTGNVGQLGLAWFADLDTARGQEATPIFLDGRLYVSTAWSMVKAYDAKTGREIWSYDPEVARDRLAKGCCDAVNRGVAAWGDKLFVGTFDGRLVALNRETGKPVWSAMTVDQSKPYTITGAPRVIDGKVIIGNGGAEFGVRGYITAYDANTGKQLWRFYTVPDNPANGKQPAYLEKAAKTWGGEWWKLGGGGTVWDGMAYDPDLDLLYIGVGNGSPWNKAFRSPGDGDDLYLSSVVAIRPKTGEYVWHFQETPGEAWDFTATQHIMLVDMVVDGKPRKVLLHAPKNGFFYVIDRETGKFISAKNFVDVNWATGVDPVTGRPIENPDARYYKTGKMFLSMPGPSGAHSWQPMARDPATGLVFIPANLAGFPYLADPNWKPAAMGFNVGVDFNSIATPADPKVRQALLDSVKGALIAWDPATQTERWRVDYPGPWNGGLLATAGNLVFQGSAAGQFAAFEASSGKRLWTTEAQTGVIAAPMTYQLDGEQYVAVLAGWGGVWALAPGLLSTKSGAVPNISRLLVYKLGGTAKLPPAPPLELRPLDPPPLRADAETVKRGAASYARFCGTCHGDAAIGGTLNPDLRRSAALEDAATWSTIVHEGGLADSGMASFAKVLTKAQVEEVRQYVIARAHEDKALELQARAAAKGR